jgi:2-C-methyl-D-erythritol 4-phosphate cytidylyltransferase
VPPDHQTWVIVVAAGQATRFGRAKQYETLAGRRILDWALDAARSVADGVVVVVPPGSEAAVEPGADATVPGGATRSASVRAGLAAVPPSATIVLVHDAARPLASPALFARVVDAVRGGADAVVPAIAVPDTLRRRDGGTVDRDELVAVQTPQGFRAEALRAAHATGAEATDDAALVERQGGSVVLVEGEPGNRKITDPTDLAAAEGMIGRCS